MTIVEERVSGLNLEDIQSLDVHIEADGYDGEAALAWVEHVKTAVQDAIDERQEVLEDAE